VTVVVQPDSLSLWEGINILGSVSEHNAFRPSTQHFNGSATLMRGRSLVRFSFDVERDLPNGSAAPMRGKSLVRFSFDVERDLPNGFATLMRGKSRTCR